MSATLEIKMQLPPWYKELANGLKVFMDHCKATGVPLELIKSHVERMVEEAAAQAVNEWRRRW